MASPKVFAPWLPKHSRLDGFYEGISQFMNEYLKPACDMEEEELAALSGKAIADPLLGYVHLRAWETALIETRLFQRLRRIRQLGFAHFVYPSLDYSRFAHTLGVLGRVDQVAGHLRQVKSKKGSKIVSAETIINEHETTLRLAALFHDIGHCIFSHVTERTMRKLKGDGDYYPTNEIVRLFSQALKTKSNDSLSPAEVLSIAIVSSPELRKFLSNLDIPHRNKNNVRDWCKGAAQLIGGVPPDLSSDLVFLSQMISGGLDCDKLDYMMREAYFARIPVSIDFVRLLDKLNVYKLSPSEIPPGLDYLKRTLPGETYNILGLSRGAQFAFEEFCLARTSLYDKIYLHHKVRAAEAQAAHIFSKLPEIAPEFHQLHRWLYLTESVIEHDELDIPKQDEVDLIKRVTAKAEALKAYPLRDKILLKRAFAFGLRNSLSEPIVPELGVPPKIVRLIDSLTEDHANFLAAVKQEVMTICKKLEIPPPTSDHMDAVLVDVLDHRRVQQGVNSVYIEHPITLPHRWTLPLESITSSYLASRALTYIFAPQAICALVYVATESILMKLYGLQFEQKEFLGDTTFDNAIALKRRLMESDCDYYRDSIQLKIKSDFLLTAKAQEDIWNVATILAPFKSFREERVTPAKVAAFLMQFREDLQEPLLQLMQHFTVINPSRVFACANSVMDSVSKRGFLKPSIVPLGNPTDSASHLVYTVKHSSATDIGKSLRKNIRPLSDAITRNSDVIIFFDDNVNSGSQAINIFAEWMGIPLPPELKLPEEHVDALPETAKLLLKRIPLHFVFGVGPSRAPVDLKEKLVKHCGIPEENINVHIDHILTEEARWLSGSESPFLHRDRNLLRDELRRVGKELGENDPKRPETAERRALGEAGAEALIVLPYNVPTMTITAFWMAGRLKNQQLWMPLIERGRNL